MFALLGFLAFALSILYLEQDVLQPVHARVASFLARRGWEEILNARQEPIGLKPRKGSAAWRALWSLQDCPYCISTWVSFFAVWYALSIHPWHRVFWLAWWGAVGVAWVVIAGYKMLQDTVKELGARDEERQLNAQRDG